MQEAAYEDKCFLLSTRCAEESNRIGARFVELSTGHVYDHGSKQSKEDGKIKPWTKQAACKLRAEEAIRGMDGLRWTVLRLAYVYGVGDVSSVVMQRLVCAPIYKHLGETMKFLWTGNLKTNTVHVIDAVRAAWHVATNDAALHKTYNVVDRSETDQGKINVFLEEIFGIKTGFQGTAMSSIACKMSMSNVVSEVNDKHMQPWMDLCKADNVANTPLSPYMYKELLHNWPLSMDGSALCAETGFEYLVPEMTTARVREVLDAAIKQRIFPSSGEATAEAQQ